jgi:hypothetical protein
LSDPWEGVPHENPDAKFKRRPKSSSSAAFASDCQGRDEVYGQGGADGAGANHEQNGVVPAGAFEKVGKAAGPGRLELLLANPQPPINFRP